MGIESAFPKYEASGTEPLLPRAKSDYRKWLAGQKAERTATETAAAAKTEAARQEAEATAATQARSGDIAKGEYESTIQQQAAQTREIGDVSVPAGAEKTIGALEPGYKGVGEMAVSEYGKQAKTQKKRAEKAATALEMQGELQ